jgi:Ca-activated chloride channel family protein
MASGGLKGRVGMKWTALGMELEGDTGLEAHLLVCAEADAGAERTPMVVNLLLDRSGSMKGAPLAAAVEAAQQLVERAGPNDFIGLLVFDAIPEQRVPLVAMNERGKQQMVQALAEIATGRGTALHQALDAGAKALTRLLVPGRKPKLLLHTDGEPSVGHESEASFQDLGQRVAQMGVSVHALGLGRHYVPEILAAMTLPSENGYEHVDGPDGLPVAMGAVFGLLFGEVAQGTAVRVRPNGFTALGCRHGFPTRIEGEELVISLGSVSLGVPRRVLLAGGIASREWDAAITGTHQERGDQRVSQVPLRRVDPGSPEGKLIRGVGLELDLVGHETVAWLSLAQRDPERAAAVLLSAEHALHELTALALAEVPAARHADRLRDLRAAVERGEGDIPMLVRRAKAARSGTHVSQVISLDSHLAKKKD